MHHLTEQDDCKWTLFDFYLQNFLFTFFIVFKLWSNHCVSIHSCLLMKCSLYQSSKLQLRQWVTCTKVSISPTFFVHKDHKSTKRHWRLFALLGSALVRAANKHVGDDFTQIIKYLHGVIDPMKIFDYVFCRHIIENQDYRQISTLPMGKDGSEWVNSNITYSIDRFAQIIVAVEVITLILPGVNFINGTHMFFMQNFGAKNYKAAQFTFVWKTCT